MLVLQIDSVDLRLNAIEPRQAVVVVQGTASSPGWSDIRLAPVEEEIPADGILDLDLVGTPPANVVPSVLAPVSASLVLTEGLGRLVGVMVRAKINALTRLLVEAAGGGQREAQPPGAGRENPVPGSFLPPTLPNFEENLTTLALFEEQKPVFGETDPRMESGKPVIGEVQAFFESRSPFGGR